MTELIDHETAETESIEQLVQTDRLQLLFRQSFVAIVGSFVAAVILGLLLWDVGSHTTIIAWLVLQGACTLMRLWLFLRYWRAPVAERVPGVWERPYLVTLVITGACWGIGAMLAMPSDSELHQAYTLFIAVGMAGGAVSAYSAYRYMTLTAIVLVLAPSTLWMLLQATPIQVALALAALLFQVSAVRSTRELSGAMLNSFRLGHEMKEAHRIADRMARTDELTGVSSRRAFFERGEQLSNYCARNKRPLCALVLDIDHFKQINDRHGHQAGDRVLRQVGELLLATFRKADVCGRLGGEEFAALLVDTGGEAVQEVTERLRANIASLVIEGADGNFLSVTASIGLCEVRDGKYGVEGMLQRADALMYKAKESGRNRVCCEEQQQA